MYGIRSVFRRIGDSSAFRPGGRGFWRSMFIQTQSTPNANSVKLLPGEPVLGKVATAEFNSMRDAQISPLARKLLVIDGVNSVFLAKDFITVTKDPSIEWAVLRPDLFEAIMDHYSSGEPVLSEGALPDHDCTIYPEDSDVVAMIKELLETRVKPAVADDGGNIIFRGFDEVSGVVDLELQGACSSCSSSSVTLKMGVENMLKHYVPEVREVREVKSDEKAELDSVSNKALTDLESKLLEKGYIR
mmetsp:Transcript_4452/g.19062  ORF Transcript_4452/g.19062 Transcript_4452/m.19062 type:complete len:245 (-) Transcript_4452:4962-5696(-)